MVFSLALCAFLHGYLTSSYLVQQEGQGHRKKSSSQMQELIQAEIAETTCEVAEKHGCKPHVSCQHAPAPFQASDEDDEDDASFNESLGESSKDDEHDAMVDNTEVSSTLLPLRLNPILISYLKLAESLPSKTIPLAQKKKSRCRKNDPK